MWSMLYLSLLNAGLGFFVAVWLSARYRFVQRHWRRGYDWLRLHPSTWGRRVQRRIFGRVNVEKVIRRLQGTTSSTIVPPLVGRDPDSRALRSQPHSIVQPPGVGLAAECDPTDSTASSSQPTELRQIRAEQIEQTTAWIAQQLLRVAEAPVQAAAVELAQAQQAWAHWRPLLPLTAGLATSSTVLPEHEARLDAEMVVLQACLQSCHDLVQQRNAALAAPGDPTVGRDWPIDAAADPLMLQLQAATQTYQRLFADLAECVPGGPCPPGVGSALGSPPPAGVCRLPEALVEESGFAGAQSTLQAWQQLTAAGGPKPAAMILIDVDQTTHWNEEFGMEAVDWILDLGLRQIAQSIRSNRGFDRVVRITGQQFLVFLGFTPAAKASFAGERLRQGFANTTWQVADQTFVIHISGAIAEYQATAPLEPQLDFLRSAVVSAKRQGGNLFVAQTNDGRFQRITGVPRYDLPTRHHHQPSEKWNPSAVVN
jgi:diguanylate cyclase (GGDEF)-like protein